MSKESENLAKSAKAMQLIEAYFPYTANIEATVEICKKMGMSEYDIRQLLIEGKQSIFRGSITDPNTGEHHFILDATLSFGKSNDGQLVVIVDGKIPEAYFADLNEREKALKAAANKKGIAGEIYRENLRLKDALEKEQAQSRQWKQIAEMLDKRTNVQ